MNRTILLATLLFIAGSFASAQKSQIAGIVLDSLSREPLPGTNILVVGTQRGTASDMNGRFTIDRLDSGTHVLRFTFIGYTGKERAQHVGTNDSQWVRILLSPHHVESQVVVVTGTRTVRSIDDVPVRVEAIPEEEIEEKLLMTPSSVAMLLNESTGMRVQTTSAATSTANLRIQGLNGRYTQILTDGIPSLGGLSAGLSLTQLVPLDLAQVEVLKGATSSLYGADAIAGVVNFIPKLPGAIPEASVILNGTTQKGFDAAGYYSGRFGETGFSILASHNRQARYDVDEDSFADVAQYNRLTITPRVLHHLSERLSVRLGLNLLQEERIGGAMDETTPPPAANPPYTEKVSTDRFELSSHIDWHYSEEQAFSAKFAWLRSGRNASYGVTPFDGIQTVYAADVQYSLDLLHHHLLIGSSLRIDDFQDQTRSVSASRSYRFSVASVFGQDEIRFSDDFTLLASGRIDIHNAFGTFFVPRLSLMYRPSSSVTLRLGGGTGYKAPTIFVEEAEEAGFRNVRPLANADPERARSLSADVNVRSILGTLTFDWNSALFFTQLNDALVADDDSLEAGIVHLRNSTGPTKSLGSEISLRLGYGDLKVLLGYTYLFATQEDDGLKSEIELNPRHSFGIVAIWENDEHQLKMGLENYWTGRQQVQHNPFRTATPSYWITGFIIEKRIGDIRVFVNFENIFDTRQTRYEPIWVGSLTTGTVTTLPIYASLEGRVINAGVRFLMKPDAD